MWDACPHADLQEHPQEGVFGFSQGATAAALFMAQLAQQQREGKDLHVPKPKFAVLVSGWLVMESRGGFLNAFCLGLSSLHEYCKIQSAVDIVHGTR